MPTIDALDGEDFDDVISLPGEAVDGNHEDLYGIYKNEEGQFFWRRNNGLPSEGFESFEGDDQEIQNLVDYRDKLCKFIDTLIVP